MSDRSTEGKRISVSDHNDPAWQVHQVVDDFELIDAWRLPVSGTFEEFNEFTSLFASLDLAHDGASKATSLLFAVRLKMGEVFGWDDESNTQPIPGCTETSLRERLPQELRKTAISTDSAEGGENGFRHVYETANESLFEISNSTVHAAIHLAWVAANGEKYVGQMGIYVKNRGRLGRFYMPAIAPFRHHIVYPALMRRLRREWEQRDLQPTK